MIDIFTPVFNESTKMDNDTKIYVPPDFLNIFGYQKIHFMIIHVPFENFTNKYIYINYKVERIKKKIQTKLLPLNKAYEVEKKNVDHIINLT